MSFRNGYVGVGDLAKYDEDGYYYIVDRKHDMIISGGLNIYPIEIEDVLYSHPDVRYTTVIGAPHEKWGEAVTAFVVPKHGKNCSSKELIEYCLKHLARYKVPKKVIISRELPMLSSGKVNKREVRKKYNEMLKNQSLSSSL